MTIMSLERLGDVAAKSSGASARWAGFCSDFMEHFRPAGHLELEELPVTRQVDASVDFIGSNTNVVKDDLLSGRLPAEGVLISQQCLRTQNLEFLDDNDYMPYRCSVFRLVGVTVPPALIEDMARNTASWLLTLDFPAERIEIWSSSVDDDLNKLATTYFGDFPLKQDTQAPALYRHVYGAPGLHGRNFNFGIRTESGFIDQVGNLVVMELDGVPIGAELGVSVPMVLSLRDDQRHPMYASPVAETLRLRNAVDIKLADCLAISQLLLSEGMRPRKKGRKRTLRTALRGAAALLEASSNDMAAVEETIGHLYAAQGLVADDIPHRVARYLELSRQNASPSDLLDVL